MNGYCVEEGGTGRLWAGKKVVQLDAALGFQTTCCVVLDVLGGQIRGGGVVWEGKAGFKRFRVWLSLRAGEGGGFKTKKERGKGRGGRKGWALTWETRHCIGVSFTGGARETSRLRKGKEACKKEKEHRKVGALGRWIKWFQLLPCCPS